MARQTLETTKTELFGHLDASMEEDEIFKTYFLQTNAFKKMQGRDRLLILVGEKGTGKSALIKRSVLSDKENRRVAVMIKRPQVELEGRLNIKINKWKDYLAREIVNSIYEQRNMLNSSKIDKYGKVISVVEKLAGKIIEKKYEINYIDFKNELLNAYQEDTDVIQIYIDDLDTGYRGTLQENESISALFTAAREMIHENLNFRFRIAIRTDLYDNIRQVDESSDKIQDAKIEIKISNHEIFAMLTKRVLNFLERPVENYLGLSQGLMMELMNPIFDGIFEGIGQWEKKPTNYILMTMTRRRPRDIFSLCEFAWEHAVENNRVRITSEDLKGVFTKYSIERLNDIVSEYHHEFLNESDLREIILALRPSDKEKKSGRKLYVYNKDNLIKKMASILSRKKIVFANHKVANASDLAKFLYKANVLIGRRDEDDCFIRRIYYMENPDLVSDLTDWGCNYEVHPAYRWAIDNISDYVLRTLDCENDAS